MRRTFSRFGVLAFVFALLLGAVVGGAAVAATQVHMESAKSYLRGARSELGMATPDKGGHRSAAIKLTTQALDEVNRAIAYAQ